MQETINIEKIYKDYLFWSQWAKDEIGPLSLSFSTDVTKDVTPMVRITFFIPWYGMSEGAQIDFYPTDNTCFVMFSGESYKLDEISPLDFTWENLPGPIVDRIKLAGQRPPDSPDPMDPPMETQLMGMIKEEFKKKDSELPEILCTWICAHMGKDPDVYTDMIMDLIETKIDSGDSALEVWINERRRSIDIDDQVTSLRYAADAMTEAIGSMESAVSDIESSIEDIERELDD